MIFLLFTGYINGCQAIIKQKYPHIIYVHCALHSLNLAISDSCEIRLVENTIGTIKETYSFFHLSSVRTEILNDHVKSLSLKGQDLQHQINVQTTCDEQIILKKLKTKLTNVCVTRWVERHTAVDAFYSLYPVVIEALQALIQSNKKEVSTKAHLFINSLVTSEFLCTLPALNKLLSFTLNVSCKFQTRRLLNSL